MGPGQVYVVDRSVTDLMHLGLFGCMAASLWHEPVEASVSACMPVILLASMVVLSLPETWPRLKRYSLAFDVEVMHAWVQALRKMKPELDESLSTPWTSRQMQLLWPPCSSCGWTWTLPWQGGRRRWIMLSSPLALGRSNSWHLRGAACLP